MLPISGESFPTTSAELASALAKGFSNQHLDTRSVNADGGEFPAIDSLTVDLTGAKASRDLRVPSLKHNPESTVTRVEKFELKAEPLYFEGAPLQLRLQADSASFVFAGAPELGGLVLNDAQKGDVAIHAVTSDLEALLHGIVVDLAGKQGIEVRKTDLELTALGPRTLSFRAETTAKMFIMTASLTLSGQLDVDESLNARFSKLTVSGEGMIAKMANGFIRPKLDALEKRVIPLLAFSLGNIRLRDVTISAGKSLTIHAIFGSAS